MQQHRARRSLTFGDPLPHQAEAARQREISYVPARAVQNHTPVGRRTDFYPLIGTFETEILELDIRAGGRELRITAGVLPEPLRMMTSLAGNDGWILGADFFRNRVVTLMLADGYLLDDGSESVAPNEATSSTEEPCTT